MAPRRDDGVSVGAKRHAIRRRGRSENLADLSEPANEHEQATARLDAGLESIAGDGKEGCGVERNVHTRVSEKDALRGHLASESEVRLFGRLGGCGCGFGLGTLGDAAELPLFFRKAAGFFLRFESLG